MCKKICHTFLLRQSHSGRELWELRIYPKKASRRPLRKFVFSTMLVAKDFTCSQLYFTSTSRVEESSSPLHDTCSATTHFHNSPSPVIACFIRLTLPLRCPATDCADETMLLSFPREPRGHQLSSSPSSRILMVDSQHEFLFCIQIMIGKLSSHDAQFGCCLVIGYLSICLLAFLQSTMNCNLTSQGC